LKIDNRLNKMNDWTNVYQQNLFQMGNMFNQMNNMMNFNNPLLQIQFMSMNQNNNPLMKGGNFNAVNQMNSFRGNRNYKINLCFTTLIGTRINMVFDCEETINDVLTKFLKRVNLDDLVGNLHNKLKFIMSAETINFGDSRKLKDVVVPGSTTLNVFVHDTQNLIGA